MSAMVAALYTDPNGPYRRMDGVECWDSSLLGAGPLLAVNCREDARLYTGPFPIVAHPPCGPWGKLRHRYRGAEHDCAPRAVEQIRRCGGVLEHPAGSLLWSAVGLPRAVKLAQIGEFDLVLDDFAGYAIEIDQCECGHVARKRTWLYLVGVPRKALEAPPYPGREPTHWCSGFRTAGAQPGASGYKRHGSAVPHGIKVCSAEQRRRTPPLLAAYLVRLARSAVQA